MPPLELELAAAFGRWAVRSGWADVMTDAQLQKALKIIARDPQWVEWAGFKRLMEEALRELELEEEGR